MKLIKSNVYPHWTRRTLSLNTLDGIGIDTQMHVRTQTFPTTIDPVQNFLAIDIRIKIATTDWWVY